ncbi:GerAB/ArcD/ProY family transporter [Niallia endozanthoxylica]|uniref:GerAB/ArcD/ProY family transporter n=1 Tax=Niallia endozanthoxylica TaxID=2036016 RepID=A0A5J5I9E0_9BACI|nr:endospore germination permease [Niallia endozanthoxylica]KAA9031583.1 GerAB/ArcD/ProY family transporter [Niallia endozanthoxylica]
MEKEKISSLQMAIMLYPSIIATSIISVPSIIAKYAKNDLWISPILASVIGFATVYIAYELHKRYPKQTVIQFSEQIVGRFAGRIISLMILSFYISGTGHIIRGYSEFIVGSFLINTPISVIMTTMVILCAFAVQGGIEVIGRLAQLFLPVFILPILIFFILLSPDYDMKNIFPILSEGIMPPIQGAIVPGGWYSEFFLIIFLLPFLTDGNKARKYGMISVLAVMVTLVMVNLAVLFVLGPTTPSKNFPLMNATRYISIAEFFENLESIAMAIWIVGAFIKISVFYYATVLGTAQWLNLSNYRVVIWPFAIIFIEFAFWSIPSSAEYTAYLTSVVPFYGPLVQTIIPLFLLLIAIVRKKLTAN